MLIRLKVHISNVDYRGNPGQVIDLPEPEAQRLIESGRAEAAEAVPETASVLPPRSAMRPAARARKA